MEGGVQLDHEIVYEHDEGGQELRRNDPSPQPYIAKRHTLIQVLPPANA